VLSFDEMPNDNSLLAEIEVDFPRLADDSTSSCPTSIDEVLEYLAIEVPGGDRLTGDDLTFLRTALVEANQYWIWRFQEPDGDPAYVTVSMDPTGRRTIGSEADYYRLSPEQFILGDYHQVF